MSRTLHQMENEREHVARHHPEAKRLAELDRLIAERRAQLPPEGIPGTAYAEWAGGEYCLRCECRLPGNLGHGPPCRCVR